MRRRAAGTQSVVLWPERLADQVEPIAISREQEHGPDAKPKRERRRERQRRVRTDLGSDTDVLPRALELGRRLLRAELKEEPGPWASRVVSKVDDDALVEEDDLVARRVSRVLVDGQDRCRS